MLKVYGVKVSYFTGKLEAYLRYKQLPYELIAASPEQLRETSNAAQVPAMQLTDGRWLTDTTPIIAWLETEYTDSSIMPENPLMCFISHLIEDYADEWLWRPAMHYRWSFQADRELLSYKLSKELGGHLKLPNFFIRRIIKKRQQGTFVDRDGITAISAKHAEQSYRNILVLMGEILKKRQFVLGDKPSLADIGLMGPMLRHFAHDPTPAAIMQNEASDVWLWVARVWEARHSQYKNEAFLSEPDQPLSELLKEIAATHLSSLTSNAEAWANNLQKYDQTVEGVTYPNANVSRYRVWCLEQLRHNFTVIPEQDKNTAKDFLESVNCWQPLWRPENLASGYNTNNTAPFATGLEVVTAKARNKKSS